MFFTSVYYEKSSADARKRLNTLRSTDKYIEVKAYIKKEGSVYRVLRKIDLSEKVK